MTPAKRLSTTWEVWGYDVWGNEEDGYTVNDRRLLHRAYHIRCPVTLYNSDTPRQFVSATPSDRQLRTALGITSRTSIETDGDDTNIYVTAENGYPLGELRCTSHSCLSPILDQVGWSP